MIDQCGVVAAECSRCIIKRCEQVRSDISDFGGVLEQAVQHILDMACIQFEQSASHNFGWQVLTADPDGGPFARHGVSKQIHDFIQ